MVPIPPKISTFKMQDWSAFVVRISLALSPKDDLFNSHKICGGNRWTKIFNGYLMACILLSSTGTRWFYIIDLNFCWRWFGISISINAKIWSVLFPKSHPFYGKTKLYKLDFKMLIIVWERQASMKLHRLFCSITKIILCNPQYHLLSKICFPTKYIS